MTRALSAQSLEGRTVPSVVEKISRYRWSIAFTLTGIIGLALRIFCYRSATAIPNSDEAVDGLMVRHFLHGHLAVFVWDRPYGGTQELLLAVPGFALFGSSWFALRIVPEALSLVAVILLWRVGLRTIGKPAAGVAAALFWVFPPFMLLDVVRAEGFYASNLVYCSALLLLALRIVERTDRFRVASFGLVLGLAFWQTSQIIPIALVTIAWIVWKAPRALRLAWIGVPFFALGALPWIVWNARHDWLSLSSQNAGFGTYLRSLRLLATPLGPMTVGLRAPYSAVPLLPSAAVVDAIWGVLLLLFCFGAYKSRGRNVSLLYVVAAVFPFLYSLASKTSYIEGWPEYTVVITPIIVLMLAQLATTYWRAVALLLVASLVTAVTIHRMDVASKIPQPIPAAPRSFKPLIAELDRLGIDRVYADYWIAYVLDFDSKERIIAVESLFSPPTYHHGEATPPPHPFIRYKPYQAEVQADARHGFVLWRRTFRQYPIVPQLMKHGYRRIFVGPFVVLAPTTLIVVVLFLGGIQLLCLSIIGSYLAHVYDEVKRRPAYIVESVIRDGQVVPAEPAERNPT